MPSLIPSIHCNPDQAKQSDQTKTKQFFNSLSLSLSLRILLQIMLIWCTIVLYRGDRNRFFANILRLLNGHWMLPKLMQSALHYPRRHTDIEERESREREREREREDDSNHDFHSSTTTVLPYHQHRHHFVATITRLESDHSTMRRSMESLLECSIQFLN
jgi:hypothetical protein